MKLNLALAGFGHVGRRFVRLLREREAELSALGLDAAIVGIATKRHGAIFSARGIDAVEQAARVERGERLDDGIAIDPKDTFGMITRTADLWQPAALVETTLLDITAGQPALDHARAALGAGLHVVTANKGPVAFAARELRRIASERAVCFLFEGAVMDGIPIFNLVRETLPAVRVTGFEGVLNTTTNQVLVAVEGGASAAAAIARMQAEGIAEADPSLDIDGWDAAAKAAALANVLLDADITPQDVDREGLGAGVEARVAAAASRGKRLKLVVRATSEGGHVRAEVKLREVDPAGVFGSLAGPANALRLDTDLLGPIVITQLEGNLTATAYALVTDLVRIAKRLQGRA
ncbi:MAG: homoserine dehydrogenase [Acidobacteriota bacterium]|nr:homoserine dehydrogenase [Acidobacteriota bacterium]